MPEIAQTTVDAPTETLRRALLIGGKREAFDQRIALVWDSLLLSCLYSAGNQTSGSPLEQPIQIAFKGEGAADCFAVWIEGVIEVDQRYFGRLAEVEPEQVLSAEVADMPKEIQAFAKRLRTITGVESLSARRTKRGLETWVFVNNVPREILYAIYEIEWDLMGAFPGIPFDFHVIDRRDRESSSLATFDEHTVSIPITGYHHA